MPRRPRGFFFLEADTDMSKPKGSFLTMLQEARVVALVLVPDARV
jgi:hypothetical protein